MSVNSSYDSLSGYSLWKQLVNRFSPSPPFTTRCSRYVESLLIDRRRANPVQYDRGLIISSSQNRMRMPTISPTKGIRSHHHGPTSHAVQPIFLNVPYNEFVLSCISHDGDISSCVLAPSPTDNQSTSCCPMDPLSYIRSVL